MLELIAIWNEKRDCWEHPADLFGLSDVYSETFPVSVTMRNSCLFERPMSALPIPDSGSSSLPAAVTLPTPTTQPETGNGHARNLGAEARLLKTPTSQLAVNGGSQHPEKRKEGGHGPTLADEVEHLLPTPVAAEGIKGTATQGSAQKGANGQVWLTNVAHDLATLNGDPTNVLSDAGRES